MTTQPPEGSLTRNALGLYDVIAGRLKELFMPLTIEYLLLQMRRKKLPFEGRMSLPLEWFAEMVWAEFFDLTNPEAMDLGSQPLNDALLPDAIMRRICGLIDAMDEANYPRKFADFFLEYDPKLRTYARRWTRNAPGNVEVNDIIQITHMDVIALLPLEILFKKPRYPSAAFDRAIFGKADNARKRHLRAERGFFVSLEFPQHLDVAGDENNRGMLQQLADPRDLPVGAEIEAAEIRRRFEVDMLDKPELGVFRLTRFGYSAAEIGALLGRTPYVVSHIRRSVARKWRLWWDRQGR